MTVWLKVAAIVVAVGLAASVGFAWRAQRRDAANLQAQLAATQTLLNAANSRQETRAAALAQTLAQLAKKQAAVQKPAQVVAALPEVLPLPAAITIPAANVSVGGNRNASLLGNPPGNPPAAQIPSQDLKPLYDFAVGCKECQAQLAASQGNLKDEQDKSQALGKERDAALVAARGGSVLRRVLRAAKWFALGAAAGAIAVRVGRTARNGG